MSVLIKGMEMPKNCSECRLLQGDSWDGLCHGASKWLDDDDFFSWYQYPEGDIDDSKPVNCPLIEVPTPHGRLIDADAVKKPIAATYYSQDEKDKAPRDDIPWMNGCNTKVKEVCWMIDDAPTVIEAEEANND